MSVLSVTVLGCSGSYASPEIGCSGYLVRSRRATVLLDCGPGTLGPLQAHLPDLAALDAMVLSHCHPDHWLELPVLRNVFTWFVPRSGVAVYGTAETHRMDRAVTVLARGRTDPFDWHEIDESTDLCIGDQAWCFSTTDHPVETLATRVDVADRSFVFSSDSGPGWSPAAFGGGIDVAMLDSSHMSCDEGRDIPHMSARQAAERAAAAGVQRLVLTHLMPGSDPEAHRAEAATAYDGPIEVARPGMRVEV
ncbi:MAG: MBL fold metallo-hydrolase [Acidimicrobiales bacterium]